jgi:hypothetical protein
VINKKKLEGIFAMFRPQIVFHAGPTSTSR